MSGDLFSGEIMEVGVEIYGRWRYKRKCEAFRGNFKPLCKSKELESFKNVLDKTLVEGVPEEYFE